MSGDCLAVDRPLRVQVAGGPLRPGLAGRGCSLCRHGYGPICFPYSIFLRNFVTCFFSVSHIGLPCSRSYVLRAAPVAPAAKHVPHCRTGGAAVSPLLWRLSFEAARACIGNDMLM